MRELNNLDGSNRVTEDQGGREAEVPGTMAGRVEELPLPGIAGRVVASRDFEFRRNSFLSGSAATFERVEDENVVIRDAYAALDSGDLTTFLERYREIDIAPPRAGILSFGVRAFLDGRLRDGLRAYEEAGVQPERQELLMCAERAASAGDDATAVEARHLASEASNDAGVFATALSWVQRVLRNRG